MWPQGVSEKHGGCSVKTNYRQKQDGRPGGNPTTQHGPVASDKLYSRTVREEGPTMADPISIACTRN